MQKSCQLKPIVILAASLFLNAPPHALADSARRTIQPPFAKKWEQKLGHLETLVADGHDLYVSTDSSVEAADAQSGKVRWTRSLGPLYWRPQAAYGNGVVYADASGSVLFAYSSKTGAKLWERKIESDYSHPLAVNGNVLYCQIDRTTLAAIDTKTHKTLWKFNLSIANNTDAFNLDCAPVFMDSGGLILGVSQHPEAEDAPRAVQILCLSPSGNVMWRRKFDMVGPSWIEQVERVGGVIYASMRRERLIALNAISGKSLWETRVPCSHFAVTPSQVVSLGNSAVHGLDKTHGTVLWNTRIVTERNVDLTGPVIHGTDAVVFAGSETQSQAVCMGPEGRERWRCELPASHLSGPAAVLPNGFLVSGYSLYRFDEGGPPPLPSMAAARKKLAETLVKRFDKLTEDEQFRLVALGPDALAPLLALLHSYAIKEESPGADMDDRSRFQEAIRIVNRLMRPEYTRQVLDLIDTLPSNTEPLSAYADILRLLAAKGDDRLTTPLFLTVAARGSVPGLDGPFEAAMSVLSRSTDPTVITYLMSHLNDTEGPARETAYRVLARTGGAAGVEAVRALRRAMPQLSDPASLVIAAAVESHYHFKETNPLPVVVELPTGLAAFDMSGFSWITVRVHGVALDYGTHTVRITPPAMDFEDAAFYPDDSRQPILWNTDKSKAKLGLTVFYDSRTSSRYDITLQKFGDDWLVIGYLEITDL